MTDVKTGDMVLYRPTQNTGDALYHVPAIIAITHADWVPGYHDPATGDWVPTTQILQPKRGCVHLVAFLLSPLTPTQFLDVPEGDGPGSWNPRT